ncbi:hypothetical protein M9458_049846, partial [Cirrhinus mrigala]
CERLMFVFVFFRGKTKRWTNVLIAGEDKHQMAYQSVRKGQMRTEQLDARIQV